MECVTANVKLSYRKRQQSSFFSKDGKLVCCNDIEGLLQEISCTHNPKELRLFVHSPKYSLQVVQLRNRKINLSLLTAHSVHMKETYKNMDLLLKAMSYSKYGWNICVDLQVTGLLLGMQSGYTKLCCFL